MICHAVTHTNVLSCVPPKDSVCMSVISQIDDSNLN